MKPLRLVALLILLTTGLSSAQVLTMNLTNSRWGFMAGSFNFGLREAEFISPSRGDGYDALRTISVSDVFPSTATAFTLNDVTKEALFDDFTVNGFTVRDMRYVALAGLDAVRLEFFLSNDTPDPLSGDLQVAWSLGADGATTVVTTSDGDNTFEAVDTWLVSDDASDTGGDVTTVASWDTTPTSVLLRPGNPDFVLSYAVNLAAGAQTPVYKVNFGIALNRTDGAALAPLLSAAAPVPEPATVGLLAAALGVFAVVAKRRRQSSEI